MTCITAKMLWTNDLSYKKYDYPRAKAVYEQVLQKTHFNITTKLPIEKKPDDIFLKDNEIILTLKDIVFFTPKDGLPVIKMRSPNKTNTEYELYIVKSNPDLKDALNNQKENIIRLLAKFFYYKANFILDFSRDPIFRLDSNESHKMITLNAASNSLPNKDNKMTKVSRLKSGPKPLKNVQLLHATVKTPEDIAIAKKNLATLAGVNLPVFKSNQNNRSKTVKAEQLPDWLASMSKEHRKAYFESHPNSIYNPNRKNKAPAEENKDASQGKPAEQPQQPKQPEQVKPESKQPEQPADKPVAPTDKPPVENKQQRDPEAPGAANVNKKEAAPVQPKAAAKLPIKENPPEMQKKILHAISKTPAAKEVFNKDSDTHKRLEKNLSEMSDDLQRIKKTNPHQYKAAAKEVKDSLILFRRQRTGQAFDLGFNGTLGTLLAAKTGFLAAVGAPAIFPIISGAIATWCITDAIRSAVQLHRTNKAMKIEKTRGMHERLGHLASDDSIDSMSDDEAISLFSAGLQKTIGNLNITPDMVAKYGRRINPAVPA